MCLLLGCYHRHPSLLISIKMAAYQKDGAGDITNVAYLNKYSFYSPSCTLATLLLNILYHIMSSLMFCGLVWVHTTDDYIDRAVPEQVVIPSVAHRLRYC